jgi:hypothetical protein
VSLNGLEPILRLPNLQLQHQRCRRLKCFYSTIKISFQNVLGYPWRCKNLQRWRCKSKLQDWVLFTYMSCDVARAILIRVSSVAWRRATGFSLFM